MFSLKTLLSMPSSPRRERLKRYLRQSMCALWTEGPCAGRRMMVDFYRYEATGEWMKKQGEDVGGFRWKFWGSWRS
jgi:hypothetical protein